MSLEDQIAALTKAVEALTVAICVGAAKATQAGTTTAPKTEAPKKEADAKKEPEKPKEPEKKKPKYNVDEVRDAFRAYGKLEGKEAALKALADTGADTVSDIDPDKYDAVMKVLGAEKA
jgi:hypothetical protein